MSPMEEEVHSPEMEIGLFGQNGNSALGHVEEELKRGIDYAVILCKLRR